MGNLVLGFPFLNFEKLNRLPKKAVSFDLFDSLNCCILDRQLFSLVKIEIKIQESVYKRVDGKI